MCVFLKNITGNKKTISQGCEIVFVYISEFHYTDL